MSNNNDGANNKPTPARAYKRSFWGLHKWKIILGVIPILLFASFTLALIFHAKIFEQYKETPIVRYNEDISQGWFVYVVDGTEYTVNYDYYNSGGEFTIYAHKTVWYSVKNPGDYILARTQFIIAFSIADGIIITLVLFYLFKYIIKTSRSRIKT